MADYYVKNGGNDGLDGLSDGNAWETVAKVSGFSFSAGDTISFKCGDTFRDNKLIVHDSGTLNSHITYKSYGTGAAPNLYGSTNIADSSWTLDAGATYVHDFTSIDVNPGCVVKHWTGSAWETFTLGSDKNNLAAGEYYYMHAESPKAIYIRMKDDSNPDGETFEVAKLSSNVYANAKSYFTVQDICFSFGVLGIRVFTSGISPIIKDCTIEYTGGDGITLKGTVKAALIDGCTIQKCGDWITDSSAGDGVTFHDTCRGVVRNCTIKDNWVAGIGCIGATHGYYYNNYIEGNKNNIIIYGTGSGSHTFLHNTVVCTGSNYSGMNFGWGAADTALIIVRNCVVYGASGNSATYGIRIRGHNVVVENSIVMNVAGGGIWLVANTDGTLILSHNDVYNNGTDYEGCSADSDSISSDPLFVDAANGDYRVKAISPCLHAALDGLHIGAEQRKQYPYRVKTNGLI